MKTSPLSLPGARAIFAQLGSKSFLEPISILVLVVPLMVLTSVATADPTNPQHVSAWLIANVFALALLAVLVLLGRFFWLRRFPETVLPIWAAVFLAGAVSWLKTYLTTQSVVWFSDLELVDLDLSSRLWGGTISGTAALLLASASVLLLREFQAERALLLTAKTMRSVPVVSAAESKKLLQLSKAIAEILKGLRNRVKAPKMEANILRELVDKYVRPLSSSLYSDLERSYQSFSARELMHTALRQSPPALALGAQYWIAAPRNVEWFGLQPGLLLTLLGSISIYAAILLLGRIVAWAKLTGPVSFLLISSLAPVAVVLSLVSLLSPVQDYSSAIILILVIWYGQASIIFGMARIALRSAARNRREVSELVQVQDADAAFALLRRNRKLMANQMHGEVQSRLMNLALASESDNALENQVVIAELETIQHLIENVRQERKSLADSVARLVQTWSGFAELEIDLGGANIQSEKEDLVFALIEEGVGNAIRHGLADRVSVRFELPNLLAVEDNGMGPKDGKPGLGSKLLSAGSTSWSLTALEEGGSRLEVELNLD